MTTVFPTELPDRPGKTPKLGLTKRLTQKLTIKRKKSVLHPTLGSSDSVAPAIAPPPTFPIAATVPYPQVLTQQPPITSPVSPVPIAPNGISHRPFASHALFKSFTGDGSTLSPQTSSRPLLPAQPGPVPPQPIIHRKQIPHSDSQNATKDPLIERFSKLRFSQSKNPWSTPVAPAASASEPSPPNTAPPFTLFRSHTAPTTTTQVAWGNMAVPNPTMSTVGQEPQPPLQRQNTNPFRRMSSNTRPEPPQLIAIDDESESDKNAAPVRRSNFSKTNYFQSRVRRRPSHRSRVIFNRRGNRRRSRSPSSSSSSSEDELASMSSHVPYPDLTARAALMMQEEQDRQLAQLLQQEENEAHAAVQLLFREELRFAANQQHTPPHGRNRKRPFSTMKRAVRPRGIRTNPVNLNSDSDSEDEDDLYVSPRGRARILDYEANYEDIMELDDHNPASSSNLHVQQDAEVARRLQAEFENHIQRDAEVARMLQAEFETQSKPATSRDCAVCGDSIPIADLPALANCTHRPETCADCFSGWIATQLEGSSWREVKCPGDGCKIQLEYHEIQQYAAQEIFQQYDTYIARAAFSEDPNFRWCRACNSGQIHLSGVEGNIFTCASCNHKCCVIHENTWHEGETCEEYDYRSSGQKERDQKAQEEASKAAIDQLSKKCPGKGCVYNIEKNDGCDHMTCSKCRYEFCWICLCDYNAIRRKGNSAHAAHCKYHSSKLR